MEGSSDSLAETSRGATSVCDVVGAPFSEEGSNDASVDILWVMTGFCATFVGDDDRRATVGSCDMARALRPSRGTDRSEPFKAGVLGLKTALRPAALGL